MQPEELPDLVTLGPLRVIGSPEQDAPFLPQGFSYCFCQEPCKVQLTKRLESRIVDVVF